METDNNIEMNKWSLSIFIMLIVIFSILVVVLLVYDDRDTVKYNTNILIINNISNENNNTWQEDTFKDMVEAWSNCSTSNPKFKNELYIEIGYYRFCDTNIGFEVVEEYKLKDGRICCIRQLTEEEIKEIERLKTLEWDCSFDNNKLKEYTNVSYLSFCDRLKGWEEIEGFVNPRGLICCGMK